MPDWRALVRDRVAGLGLAPADEADLIDELAAHLADRYQDLRARQVPDEEAIAASLDELRGHERFARDLVPLKLPLAPPAPMPPPSSGGVRAVFDDMVFAWRRVRHAKGFAIVAVLTIAFAVGANTAILGVADAVLFRPLPYADADNVFIIQMMNRQTGGQGTAVPYAFLDAIAVAQGKVSAPAFAQAGRSLQDVSGDATTPIPVAEVSANYFPLLGVAPARGRLIDERDIGREGRAAVVSYAAWRQRFGGDPGLVGKTVTLGTSTFDVVGILPSGFVFPSVFVAKPEIVTLMKPSVRGPGSSTFNPIVRVAPGVSLERAQAEVNAATVIAQQAEVSQPGQEASKPWTESTAALNPVRDVLYPVGRPIMRYLLVAAALVLLIGCANLANMMLVRGRRGEHDTAVRLALGAGRVRLVRPLVFEALIVGLVGSLLALLVTNGLFEVLLRQVPRAAYGSAAVGVDARVGAMSFTLGLLAALGFGAIPAWKAAGLDVMVLLHGRRRRDARRPRLRQPLLVAQVALALIVVFGAIIATRGFIEVLATPLGFSPEAVLRLSVAIPAEATTPADRQAFIRRAIDALRIRPDVLSAGAITAVPFSGQMGDDAVVLAGTRSSAGIVHVLPGYFETLQIAILRGRSLLAADLGGDASAAVVSNAAAGVLFPDVDPIGRTFESGAGHKTFQVVGVSADVIPWLDRSSGPPFVYVLPEDRMPGLFVVARLRSQSDRALAALTSGMSVTGFRMSGAWLGDRIDDQVAVRNPRFQTLVLGTFAALAVGLTASGIFGVVSYLVVTRKREMGVRLAIGASPQSLVGLVVRQALVPIVAGLAIGLIALRWASRLAEAQLFKVDTHDPLTVVVAALTVVSAAAVAAYLPARRAGVIDPVDVLRSEG